MTIQNLIGSGMDPKTENNPYLGFIYTSFQVLAAILALPAVPLDSSCLQSLFAVFGRAVHARRPTALSGEERLFSIRVQSDPQSTGTASSFLME